MDQAVDVHSSAYAFGEMVGASAFALAVVLVIWKASSSWRNAPISGSERRRTVKRRQRNVQIITACLILAAGIEVSVYAQSSSTGAAASTTTDDSTPTTRTFTPPRTVDGYTLLTGMRATDLASRLHHSADDVPDWFYALPSDTTSAELLLSGTTIKEWMKTGDGTAPTIADTMAGAGLTNATPFPAGPRGGSLECGSGLDQGIPVDVCAWRDDSMELSLFVLKGTSTKQAAALTLDIRNAGESAS